MNSKSEITHTLFFISFKYDACFRIFVVLVDDDSILHRSVIVECCWYECFTYSVCRLSMPFYSNK